LTAEEAIAQGDYVRQEVLTRFAAMDNKPEDGSDNDWK